MAGEHGDNFAHKETVISDESSSDGAGDVKLPAKINEYSIKQRIGMGAMGVVYQAQQPGTRRDVAIKVMHPSMASPRALRRFEHEAQLLAKLQHPGIAQIFEAGTWDDGSGARPFFAMEYVSSARELNDYVASESLDFGARIDLFLKICDAVEYGHRRGIIHRDLKPSNVLVDLEGAPRVIDFGVARSVDSTVESATLQTQSGQLIGTLQYMSPEQIELDPSDLDTRSDVYALGVMLYQLLLDQLPYELEGTAITTASRIVVEQPPVPPRAVRQGIPVDLETICLKALRKDRQDRYQSVGDLAEDLRRYQRDEPVLARPPGAMESLSRAVRKNKAIAISAFVILLGLLASTVISLLFAADARSQRDLAREREAQVTATNAVLSQIINGLDPQAFGELIMRSMNDTLGNSATPLDTEIIGLLDDINSTDVGLQVIKTSVIQSLRDAIDAAEADDPVRRAAILQSIARYYQIYGQFRDALPVQEESLSLHQELYGPDHELTMRAMLEMGKLNCRMGRVELGQSQLVDLWNRQKVLIGPEHLLTLESLYRASMATGHTDIGGMAGLEDYETALEMIDEVIAGRTKINGEYHTGTLAAVNVKANLLMYLDREEEAVLLMDELDRSVARTHGPTHHLSIDCLLNKAWQLTSDGRFEEAIPILRDAIDRSRQQYGSRNPRTLSSLAFLSGVLMDSGRFEEALPLLEETLEAQEFTQGRLHVACLDTAHMLAYLYMINDRHDESDVLYARLIKDMTEVHGASHHRTNLMYRQRAMNMASRGRLDEGIVMMDEACRRHREYLGEQNERTLFCRINHVQLLRDAGRYPEAADMFEEILPLALGTNSDDLKRSAASAGASLYQLWHDSMPDQSRLERSGELRAMEERFGGTGSP